jgi:anti-anti-sigma factor
MEIGLGMRNITSEEYNIQHDLDTSTITFAGSLSLNSMEDYLPIVEMLNTAIDNAPEKLRLDLRKLEFLNSSGISALSKFVIKARKSETPLIICGSETVVWQTRSLKNLQRLMPALILEWA